jgi:hypothetical protein
MTKVFLTMSWVQIKGRENPRWDFYLTRTVSFLERQWANFQKCGSEKRCGKKRRETSRPTSTKCLPQCVCSILSISKAGPPAHSCVVVCSYLAQPYPRTSSTTVQLVYLYIVALGVWTGWDLVSAIGFENGGKGQCQIGGRNTLWSQGEIGGVDANSV